MIKAVVVHLALLVAAIAVSIGAIGKLKPELFLHIPNVGFILWAITGHPVPPYFRSDAWETSEMKTWIRDKDVVVATAAKSGTTWMLYCAHQIRVKGSEEFNFTDVSYSTPWPDFVHKPGMSWAEQKALFDTVTLPEEGNRPLKDFYDNPAFPFRVFKSHFTPKESGGFLPVKEFPNVKFLAMTRTGMDVVASMVPFFNAHSDEFRKIWGGFPPVSDGDLVKDTAARVEELLPGGMLYALYFEYVKQWWPLRHEPNVLLMHYSDAVADIRGTVAKLAQFYEVDLNEEELDKVSHQCSLPEMKKITHQFSYAVPLNPDIHGKVMRAGSMTRKGGVGSGKIALTEEQQVRWRAAEEQEFAGDANLLRWARHGGAFE